MQSILIVMGTRPEAIKLAPLILAMRRRRGMRVLVCVSGQHRQLIDPMLEFFGIRPDYDLQVMRPHQTLGDLTGHLLKRLDPVLQTENPAWVIVQGDTTTAMASALAAYYRRIRIAHVEAGLRTNDKYAPYPEEINRRLITPLADAHFAPTDRARRALRREGVTADRICLSGNTVVDGLHWALRKIRKTPPAWPADIPKPSRQRRLILVTGHRRENFGEALAQVCMALRDIADTWPDCELIYPVHLNPEVRRPVMGCLGNHPRIHLVDPLSYPVMVALLQRCWLILTDSGGIQEEAPTFQIPCLVMRESTERPEGIRQGVAKLVGADRQRIVRTVNRLMRDERAYARMALGGNPYGDGRASERILDWLEQH